MYTTHFLLLQYAVTIQYSFTGPAFFNLPQQKKNFSFLTSILEKPIPKKSFGYF